MKKILTLVLCTILLTIACLTTIGCTKKEKGDDDVLSNFKITKEYFEGKKVVFYGDSITIGLGIDFVNGEKRYCDILADNLGFNFKNFAQSGSKLTKDRMEVFLKAGVSVMKTNEEHNKEADYAIIAYGTNDFSTYDGSTLIGNKTDNPQYVSEINSFYGGIRMAVNMLRGQNPDIKILFLTPIYRTLLINRNGESLVDFGKAIENLAEELDYRVINMFSVFNETNFYNESQYSEDGLHPNILGHAKMAEYVLGYDVEE